MEGGLQVGLMVAKNFWRGWVMPVASRLSRFTESVVVICDEGQWTTSGNMNLG